VSEVIELKAKGAEPAVGLARISKYVEETFEMTSSSLVPLLKRSELDERIFFAGVVSEFSAAYDKSDKAVQTFIRSNPKRYVAAIAHQAASLGLQLGTGPTGRMASIIFRAVNQKQANGRWEKVDVNVTVQPEWRGVIHLIRRANPDIVDIKIGLVGPNDIFETDELHDTIIKHHTPPGEETAEPFIELLPAGFALHGLAAAYAMVSFSGGRKRFVRLSKVDFCRSISSSDTMKLPYEGKPDNRRSSPWVNHPKPMCYKTVAHHLYRKPDIWSAAGGMDFAALESLGLAAKVIDEVDGNHILPQASRDPRIDQLAELAMRFGGDDKTVQAAALSLGYEDPNLMAVDGRFGQLVDKVKSVLRPA
jgi:recombinational DNA repair protein RecT